MAGRRCAAGGLECLSWCPAVAVAESEVAGEPGMTAAPVAAEPADPVLVEA